MRILIIGGTAFTGPHIVRSLTAMGHQVTVFHRGQAEAVLPDQVKHIHGHLRDLQAFKRHFEDVPPEVVLHMVASDAQDAWTLMRTFHGVARRVVAISSEDVYRAYNRFRAKETGPPDPVPLSEDAPLRETLYPYRGESLPGSEHPEGRRSVDDYDKILVERIVMSEPELPGTVLRLPAVYGPNDPQHRLFDYLKRMDDNRPAILMEEGAAHWRWTRGYVENVAHAIVLAVTDEVAEGGVYNVGEAEALSEEEWVKEIGRAAGWRGRVIALPVQLLPEHLRRGRKWAQDWAVDTGRIRNELGFEEVVPRDEALQKTITWERDNPPEEVAAGRFDYEAEDAVLAELSGHGS